MASVAARPAPRFREWNYRLTDGRRVEVVASELPANRVSGDIADVFPAGENSLLVAMGDASGHGVAAGMLIVDVRRLLSMMAGTGRTSGELMTEVNRYVMKRSTSSRFVTMTLLTIDLQTGGIAVASCAQDFYRLDATGRTTVCEPDSVPIGILDDEVFPTTSMMPLQPGELIVLISDGFREGLDGEGRMYGEPRLFEQFAAGHHLPAREFMLRLYDDVDRHKNGGIDHDDMTVVVVRVV